MCRSMSRQQEGVGRRKTVRSHFGLNPAFGVQAQSSLRSAFGYAWRIFTGAATTMALLWGPSHGPK